MTPDAASNDAVFAGVETPSRERCGASPAFARETRGFLIAAPSRVVAGERTRLTICAASQFGDERRTMPSALWDAAVLVVVDVTHNRFATQCLADQWSSPLSDDEEEDEAAAKGEEPAAARPPDPALASARRPGIIREYFNFDAGEFVPLAPDDAVYYLFVTRGPYQSNSVRVEAVKPPRPVR